MQETHIAQMNKIITKQKKHKLDIEQLQWSQLKIKENLEEKMENKIEQQTNLLSSLVSMIHKMKGDKASTTPVHMNKNKKGSSKIDTTAISQGEMTDCSYSEEEDIIPSPPRKAKVLKVPTTTTDSNCPKSPTPAVVNAKDASNHTHLQNFPFHTNHNLLIVTWLFGRNSRIGAFALQPFIYAYLFHVNYQSLAQNHQSYILYHLLYALMTHLVKNSKYFH
jgi:hypothetical protein